MAHIRINYDGLQQQSSAMRSCIHNYEAVISRTNSLLAQIQESWEGNASMNYTQRMANYMQQIRKMIEVLNRFRTISDSVANRFSATDTNCANIINRSF